jgi:hypothetical protein
MMPGTKALSTTGGSNTINPVKAMQAMWPHQPVARPDDSAGQHGQTDQQADEQGGSVSKNGQCFAGKIPCCVHFPCAKRVPGRHRISICKNRPFCGALEQADPQDQNASDLTNPWARVGVRLRMVQPSSSRPP